MEYRIAFEVPDEVDALITDLKRKWVSEKVTEFIRELVANEAGNGLDAHIRQIEPEIIRGDDERVQTES